MFAVFAVFAVVSCSATSDSAGAFGDGSADGQSRDGDSFPDAGAPLLSVNGVVLVHAASFPAFRICFEGTKEELPLPSTDVMPESNVVGVEVGTAVRLPPLSTAGARPLGRAFVFPELALRGLYPTFGGFGAGPTCATVLQSHAADATEVGEISSDLSSGLHALILQGCRPLAGDPQATTARCGDDWQASTGNLRLKALKLTAYMRRPEAPGFPVQIVQLSPGLERRRAGRSLGLAFGVLDREGGAPPAPFIQGNVPFGTPVPDPPAQLDYAASDLESYATSGVFVTLGKALDDAGAEIDGGLEAGTGEVVLSQSLEDIQRRSASRSLPPDWFAAASSYVVLSIGDTDPRFADGGPDKDERRALHLLAIPLAAPVAAPPAAPDASR